MWDAPTAAACCRQRAAQSDLQASFCCEPRFVHTIFMKVLGSQNAEGLCHDGLLLMFLAESNSEGQTRFLRAKGTQEACLQLWAKTWGGEMVLGISASLP
jgi:hypothetical protein